MDLNKLNNIWDKHGKNLIKPSKLLIKDFNKNNYYVIKDSSFIVFMVLKNSNITYCIPKKYLANESEYYFLTEENINKLITVSCRDKKNEYEVFVQKNILDK
jgi:hypothetical protein